MRARRVGATAMCLPYFRRAETRAAGGDAYRGDSGPLQTRYGALTNPLHVAWVNAAEQAGYPVTPDINGFQQEGFGRLDMTVGAGRRSSAANAYLRPAMKPPQPLGQDPRPGHPHRLRGRRATGVAYRRGGEDPCRHGAARGHPGRRRDQFAAASPAVRRRSGRGTATATASSVVHDLPGVGRESAGPPGVLFPGGLETAGHPLFGDEPGRQGAHRRPLAADPRRPWRQQSFRDRRLHPQPRRRPNTRTSSITSCPWP